MSPQLSGPRDGLRIAYGRSMRWGETRYWLALRATASTKTRSNAERSGMATSKLPSSSVTVVMMRVGASPSDQISTSMWRRPWRPRSRSVHSTRPRMVMGSPVSFSHHSRIAGDVGGVAVP